jgi:anti-sigma regulatory factor (Ser/Thr protein kinase)
MFPRTTAIPIQEQSQVGEARRAVIDAGGRAGLTEESIGKAAVIATELGTNLIKHAGGGEILFRSLNGKSNGLEILAIDKGPGISNWNRAFEDGFSTAGSQGNGLGAIARLSTEHFCYSVLQKGTIIGARLRAAGPSAEEKDFEVGAICLPVHGEEECGDSWVVVAIYNGVRAVVADGLGHGSSAAEASQAAIGIARDSFELSPAAFLERAHGALRATRGAAVAVADIDQANGTVNFAGIGNIAAAIATDGKIRQMASHNGTAGHQMRRLQEFKYPWTSSSMLLMHSDGLGTRWSLDAYPGMSVQHAGVVGAALYRDFTRGRDDVTVLTLRQKGRGQ